MATGVTMRPLGEGDRSLRTAPLADVNRTGEERGTCRDVDEDPVLRHYLDLLPERGDFGFVGEDVPELAICAWSGHRGEGIGAARMRRSLAGARRRGIRQLGLGVDAADPSRDP